MARVIKKFFNIVLRFDCPRSIFDLTPGERRYVAPGYHYPSTEEAWRQDWQNIESDFQSAIAKLDRELA